MNKNAMIGVGGGLIAIVAAVVIYMVGFSGGSGGPTGGGSSQAGEARAEKFFAALKSSDQFKSGGGTVKWGSAETFGDEGLLMKKVVIAGTNKKGEKGTITADEVRVNKLDWKNPQSSPYGDLEIKGLTSPQFTENPQMKQFMAATGMEKLVFDMKFNVAYKKDGQLMDIQTIEVTARELGTFTIQAQIYGIDIEALRKMQAGGKVNPAAAMGMLAAVRIGKINISFKDNGAIDKSATMQAKKTGGDKDKVISGAIQMLEAQKAGMPFDIAKKAADAAIKFLKNKSAITVKAEPGSPVAVLPLAMSMQRPSPAAVEKIVKDLNISVSAE